MPTDAKMKGTERMRMALAAFLSAQLFVVILLLALVEPPEGSQESLFLLVGMLATMTAAAIGFYFNTSHGSSAKQQDIVRLAENAVTTATPETTATKEPPAAERFAFTPDPHDPYRRRYPTLNAERSAPEPSEAPEERVPFPDPAGAFNHAEERLRR